MKEFFKKVLAVLLAITLLLPGVLITRADAPESLPLRLVFESVGAQVVWNNPHIEIHLPDGNVFVITPGSATALENGVPFALSAPIYVVNGISFISEADAVRILLGDIGDAELALTVATAVASANALMDAFSAAGLTVAIVDAQTGFTFTQGFGYVDTVTGQWVDEHTLFHVGSVAKMFTAMAVMRLVEEGYVNLDNPVVHYLPEFRLQDCPMGGRSDDITVRMLLSNTSGTWLITVPGFLNEGTVINQVHVNTILDWLPSQQLNFPPGAAWQYANAGWTVLTILVARVMGYDNAFEGFIAATDALVFAPMGMGRSTFDFPQSDGNVAMPHLAGERYMRYVTGAAGGGAMLSSAYDMAVFMHSFLNNRLLQPASTAEMMSNQTLYITGSPVPHYGFGLIGMEAFGFDLVGHDGLLENFGTAVFFHPETGLGVFVNANDTMGIAFVVSLAQSILATAIEEKTGIPMTLPDDPTAGVEFVPIDIFAVPITLTADEVAAFMAFQGVYDFGDAGIIEIAAVDGQFYALALGMEFPLTPMSDNTFDSLLGRVSFETVDGDAIMVVNAGGVPVRGERFTPVDITPPAGIAPWLGTYRFVPSFDGELPLISEITLHIDPRGNLLVSATQRTGTGAFPLIELPTGDWLFLPFNAPFLFGVDADGYAYFNMLGGVYRRVG